MAVATGRATWTDAEEREKKPAAKPKKDGTGAK